MIWALAYLPVLAGLAIWASGGSRIRLGASGAVTAMVVLGLAVGLGGATGRHGWSEAFTLHAALPPLAQAVAVTVPAILLAVTLFAAAHEAARGLPRLIGLMLIFTGGMELVVIAADLVTLLIGWEIVGACSWALIGHKWRERAAGPSAAFAFVLTRAGDLGLFLALMATVAATGRAGYDALGALDGWSLTLAAFGLLVAAVSKAGQVPFAPWLFRAMDGPTSVSALLHSATMVAAGAYILARLHPQLSAAPGFGIAAMGIGLATAILGGVVALRQTHAKKLLAGSTSAQTGLMIAAVGAGYPAVAVLHLIVHAATKSALFLAAGIAHRATGSFDLRMKGIGRSLPATAAMAAVAALSLAAVPPFAGGWSKEAIVRALEHASVFWAAAGIAAGGLGAAYATRFAVSLFGKCFARETGEARGELAGLAVLVAGTLGLSALWLPWMHDRAAEWLGGDLPAGTRAGFIVALAATAFGVLAGLRAARAGWPAPQRDWLGLSALYEHGAIRPFRRCAEAAARFDDGVVDMIPRGTARIAASLARFASQVDDHAIDGLAPGGASRRMQGAIGGIAAGMAALSGLGAGLGERLSDLIPSGTGRVTGMAGADLRRLQTGLAHHYYTILVAGLALALTLVIIGG